MEVYQAIQALLDRALACEMIKQQDEIYARNQIMALLGLDEFIDNGSCQDGAGIPDILDALADYAAEKGIIEGLDSQREIFSARIMNVLIQRPSDVNALFYEKYNADPNLATDYFYELSKNSNYIQTKQIAKNISYSYESDYGMLDITINLSKPEKDPKQIAIEREMKSAVLEYPKCLLCIENEGYAGRIGYPARSNHRIIGLELGGESWYLQYSPYVYYNEHCIVLSAEHRDMKISRGAFTRLLEFVGKFPAYFLGSNADLPIVGGSILTHDHYQGGKYDFAMAKAEANYSFQLGGFPSIEAAMLKWPLSAIRIRGKNPEELADAADKIFETWMGYSDPEAGIEAFTGGTRHNTVTPIARMRDGQFEMDLVLRNNRTSDEHPLGIFHPHSDVHHIKKENIGLIEVMGLAVLPARLENELKEIKKYLLGEKAEVKEYHLAWANEMKEKHAAELSPGSVSAIIRQNVGAKFARVLEDAGVFKQTEEGKRAFRKFTDLLG
ncbi:UDP-glucose--hexose-1-phosphate uridylyltransferase [Neobacillus piezotolerans]|uniref:Galactose-1-phosphate uridylyltransferase n=1 Tax=Neobacillus piezotolerans TaxID=2259171 RepID=A0A3D8GR62_9BACI|nr:UDP-glucose--hexose-1-phosphate uridylyltransferase [Neobacillus piezotolerans]RDU36965.1 UDP-glucose--hexose-1-phosphate uridylyltransferase [Neobacillus piezotolerans]